jgi:glycosyltransferase involved in cell wall biosynthesis
VKRLLLIAYYYPPREAIGSVRPAGLAKYLPQFGWEPIVLTPALPQRQPSPNVVETGYREVLAVWKERFGLDPGKGLHEQLELRESSKPGGHLWHTRAVSWLKSWLTYPDIAKGWLPFGRAAIQELASRHPIDVIVSTSPPISCHLLAADAKAMLHCPWIADCRDMIEATESGSRFLLWRLAALERRTLKKADALVTVSLPWAEKLQKQYPSKPVASITNGFDADDFAVAAGDLTKTFTITHTGDLYAGRRNPTLLFEGLSQLFSEGTLPRGQVRVRFFGPADTWLKAAVARYHLEEVVEILGSVPRQEALLHQRESQILLLLGINIPVYSGGVPGKLFEYLAAGRPSLAFGGEPGVIGQILDETGAGKYVTTKAELCAFLTQAYAEFRDRGNVSYRGNATAIERYTQREMARKFAQTLDASLAQDSGAKARPSMFRSKEPLGELAADSLSDCAKR